MKNKSQIDSTESNKNHTGKRILIIGATSAIATACARKWAEENAHFFLVGRNPEKLEQISKDLSVRGASSITTHTLDLNQFSGHSEMLNACYNKLEQVDVALIAHGSLPDQKACEKDVDLALKEFSNNGLSVLSLLTLLANRMETQRSGTIAVISSVAGDRGRPSNYLYGTAKAAVTTFCEGLRARLFRTGVHVVTIKPGFVNTPMTQGLALPSLLVATPQKIAKDITHAITRKKNVVYTPNFWMAIMLVIKSTPNFVFKKLSL